MGDARFVFVADEDTDWHDEDGDEGTVPRVWWRLVAANNRVLGRLAGTAAGEHASRARAAELQSRIDEVVSTLTTDGRGQWVWTIALDGVEFAQCAHPYARRVDCVRTLALFTEGIRAADPQAGLVRFPMGGRYRVRPNRIPAPVIP